MVVMGYYFRIIAAGRWNSNSSGRQRMTMTDKNEFAAISRREAIGVIAVTSASGAVLTGSHPVVTVAGASVLGAPAAGVAQNADEPTRSLAKLAAEHFEPLIG